MIRSLLADVADALRVTRSLLADAADALRVTQSDLFPSAEALRVTQSDLFPSGNALRVTQSDLFPSAEALRVTQSDVFRFPITSRPRRQAKMTSRDPVLLHTAGKVRVLSVESRTIGVRSSARELCEVDHAQDGYVEVPICPHQR